MNTTRTQQHGCDSSSPTDKSPTGTWTTGPSPKSPPPTSGDTPNIIGSAASQAGPSHFGLLDGLTTALSGLLASLASPSAPQESSSEPTTNDTSPPSSLNSSASAALQESLESRLLQNLHGISGSPEYVWSLKRWDTPSGPSIFALRARARSEKDGLCVAIRPLGSASSSDHPTSDNGFTGSRIAGWITPVAADASGGPRDPNKRLKDDRQTRNPLNMGNYKLDLKDQVGMVGWPTTTVGDSRSARNSTAKRNKIPPSGIHQGGTLTDAVTRYTPLTGYPTPCAGDTKWMCSQYRTAEKRKESGKQMYLEAMLHMNFSPAETARPAALNPAFSRWLQAYPVEWCQAAIRAHRSMPTTRRKRGT